MATWLEWALIGWAIMAVSMSILWISQRKRERFDVVDVAWSIGVGALAVAYTAMSDGDSSRRLCLMAIVLIWATRLTMHLSVRIARSAEDGRYQKLMEDWGDAAPLRMFAFYQVQAAWALLFAIPCWIAATNATAFPSVWDGVALLLAATALIGESIADRQLAKFKSAAENRGQVCNVGLWKWSRHPNYFFEWFHWWSYAFFAIGAPLGYVAFAGPVVMLFFLLKVTGIPPAEARALETRGDAYRRYQRTTSAFLPLPPKKEAEMSS